MDSKHQDHAPTLTQICIAVGVAFLSAKDHFEAAQILLNNEKPNQAYSQWLLGIEELGKIVIYLKVFKTEEEDRNVLWKILRPRLENHPKKLLSFFSTLNDLIKQKSRLISFKFIHTPNKDIEAFLEQLAQTHARGDLHNDLHELRQHATYTVMNNDGVGSPGGAVADLPNGLLELIINFSVTAGKGVDALFSHFLGQAYEQLGKYYRANKQDRQTAYRRIEKTLSRVIPAMETLGKLAASGVRSLITDPEDKRVIGEVSPEGRKFITLVFAFKEALKISASDESLDL